MLSHEISWWDIFVVQVSVLWQWYLTKLVGEIFLWKKLPCYINDILQISWWDNSVVQVSLLCQWCLTNKLVRYFCGTSDTIDNSDTSDFELFCFNSPFQHRRSFSLLEPLLILHLLLFSAALPCRVSLIRHISVLRLKCEEYLTNISKIISICNSIYIFPLDKCIYAEM